MGGEEVRQAQVADLKGQIAELSEQLADTFLTEADPNEWAGGNKLPADLKKVIDANSGADTAAMFGRAMDEGDKVGLGLAQKAGNKIITLDAAVIYAKLGGDGLVFAAGTILLLVYGLHLNGTVPDHHHSIVRIEIAHGCEHVSQKGLTTQ